MLSRGHVLRDLGCGRLSVVAAPEITGLLGCRCATVVILTAAYSINTAVFCTNAAEENGGDLDLILINIAPILVAQSGTGGSASSEFSVFRRITEYSVSPRGWGEGFIAAAL